MPLSEKPDYCTDDHLIFLDDLRKSGVTNMFRAAPFLEDHFEDLTSSKSRKVLQYWMFSFGQEDC